MPNRTIPHNPSDARKVKTLSQHDKKKIRNIIVAKKKERITEKKRLTGNESVKEPTRGKFRH